MIENKIQGAQKFLLVFAMLWSIAAGLWIALTPQTIYELEAAATNSGSQNTVESMQQVSWFQVQGWWGVFILVVFAGLYCSAAFLLWHSRILPGSILGVICVGLTFLAGFSIGPFYLPAAGALLAGLVLLFWMRL